MAIDARPTDHPFPRLVRRNHRIGGMLLEFDDPLDGAGPVENVVIIDEENGARERCGCTLFGLNLRAARVVE